MPPAWAPSGPGRRSRSLMDELTRGARSRDRAPAGREGGARAPPRERVHEPGRRRRHADRPPGDLKTAMVKASLPQGSPAASCRRPTRPPRCNSCSDSSRWPPPGSSPSSGGRSGEEVRVKRSRARSSLALALALRRVASGERRAGSTPRRSSRSTSSPPRGRRRATAVPRAARGRGPTCARSRASRFRRAASSSTSSTTRARARSPSAPRTSAAPRRPAAWGNTVIVAHRDTHFAFLRELVTSTTRSTSRGARGVPARYRVREVDVVDKARRACSTTPTRRSSRSSPAFRSTRSGRARGCATW